jgi:hypothetical protein
MILPKHKLDVDLIQGHHEFWKEYQENGIHRTVSTAA